MNLANEIWLHAAEYGAEEGFTRGYIRAAELFDCEVQKDEEDGTVRVFATHINTPSDVPYEWAEKPATVKLREELEEYLKLVQVKGPQREKILRLAEAYAVQMGANGFESAYKKYGKGAA